MQCTPLKQRDNKEIAYQDFLNNYRDFGRTFLLDKLRRQEFAQLDDQQHVYLDYTGANLCPRSLVENHANNLQHQIMGNPHSGNPSSQTSTRLVEQARSDLLAYFNADPEEYLVIFTANASSALKLIGESYPFSPDSHYLLTADNHNSVHGIREFARRQGAPITYIPPESSDLRITDIEPYLASAQRSGPGLFAYPAQSNFSGVQHPLTWIAQAQHHGFDVLLDAAAFVPTNRLDMSAVHPDFVCMSFYKMFGYPTGIGALIARRTTLNKLRRPWFAGGTVQLASARTDIHMLADGEMAFEEGSLNFHNIPAVSTGLAFLETINIELIHERVSLLSDYLLQEMQSLRHNNGQPLIKIYGPLDTLGRGGTIAFNLFNPDGTLIPCSRVEAQCNQANISIRSGCFCNPGASEYSLGHSSEEIRSCFKKAGTKHFEMDHYTACMGEKALGAVRVSLGLASNFSDVYQFREYLRKCADTLNTAQD